MNDKKKEEIRKQIKPGSTAYRTFELTRKDIDKDARTVELAFSSEEPYDRGWMIEILDHSPGAVDLTRLKSAGPLLLNHERDDQIGVIESASVDADRVGRAVVRFGKGALADEIFEDVIDGIRRNVSVGYMIYESILKETSKDGPDTYLVTKFTPFEVSIVPIPADISVGVSRAAEDSAGIEIIEPEEKEIKHENRSMEMPKEIKDEGLTPEDVRAAGADAQAAERKRSADLLAIGKQFARFGGEEIAAAYVTSGKSVDELRAALLEKASSEPVPTAEIGLDKKETKRFSIVRAINALVSPTDRAIQESAAFERECSDAVAIKMGRSAQGLFLPQEVLGRDLNVGTATAGGHTVATELEAADFISVLRNAMVLSGLGIQVLTGLVGDIAIPRQTGGATSYWVAESGAPTESEQAFDQVTLSPKTVGAFTDISRKLLKQSSIDVESFVQNDLATVLGLAIELAAINGSGVSNEPMGILNATGIGDVAGGTNGLAPTYDHIIDLESDVSVANAAIGNLAYLVNATTRGKLKKTFVDSGSNAERVWDNRSPETPLNGYKTEMTNAVPSNLTKGSGANLSAIIYGNFADLLLAMWGALDLTVDPYTASTSGTVRVVTLQDVDVAIRHAESFSAMKDAITA